MSFYVEWKRLAEQAYAQIPPDARLPVAEAIIDLMRHGVPEDAEPTDQALQFMMARDEALTP